MDEINELGKYLRRSKENVETKLPIPPKGENTVSIPWLVLEVMVVLAAVFVFVQCVASARRAASHGMYFGMSMAMYLVTRVAAFAGILAFLHFGVRACVAGTHRSRGWVQRMGWGALAQMVVVLTIAAFMMFMFFSIANYGNASLLKAAALSSINSMMKEAGISFPTSIPEMLALAEYESTESRFFTSMILVGSSGLTAQVRVLSRVKIVRFPDLIAPMY